MPATDHRLGPECLQVRDESTDQERMKRSLAAVVVTAMFVFGIPAAFAADETPAETGETTTTTAATTTTTTAATTTTTVPPVAEDPPVEDTQADAVIPTDEPRVPRHQVRRVNVTRHIVFPVAGINYYYPGFGDCRDDCAREHHGIDIMTYGWKGVPVVAAHSGTIRKVRDDREWCIVEVKSPDRWFTRYVHLNNDTPGYDDKEYECLLPGIEVGAHVEAGQIIGWIGDSGNAEWTPPHLHFEIRMPNGLPVDPYKSLKSAERIRFNRVGVDGDPIATAAEIAGYAYSNGSGVVNVMATTDHQTLLAGGFSALELSGPLLLSEPGYLPEATIEMFDRLNPSRVIVVGDGLDQAVIDQLELRFSILGRMPMPSVTGESYVEPDTGTIVEIPEPEPASLSLVVVGDRSELPKDMADDLDRMAWTMQTTVFDEIDSGRRIGRDTYQGPGRSGSRNVLYFQTGDTYTRIRAREAPETPPEYGVIVLEAGRVSEATLTFLTSLADLPVMPLWR